MLVLVFFLLCFVIFMADPDFIFPASGFSAEPIAAGEVLLSGPLPEGPLTAGWAKALPTRAALMSRAAMMDLRIIFFSDKVVFLHGTSVLNSLGRDWFGIGRRGCVAETITEVPLPMMAPYEEPPIRYRLGTCCRALFLLLERAPQAPEACHASLGPLYWEPRSGAALCDYAGRPP
jgi:hypothetical protein